jgi:hypothetical protein
LMCSSKYNVEDGHAPRADIFIIVDLSAY